MIASFLVSGSGESGGSPGADGFNPWTAAWVQDQRLQITSYPPTLTTPYPFARLAWLNSTNPGKIFIYHQMSESLLVEDAYSLEQGWASTSITIDTGT